MSALGAALSVLAAAAALRLAAVTSRAHPGRRRLWALGAAGPWPRATTRPPLLRPPPRVAAAVHAAGLAVDASLLWTAWLAVAAVTTFGVTAMATVPLGLAAAVGLTAAPMVAVAAGRHRRDRLVEAALPGALEAIAQALRSGASLTQAIAQPSTPVGGSVGAIGAADVHADLARVAADARSGVPLSAALDAWAQARPLPAVRLAAAALALAADAGGPQARAIDGVAATLRDRAAVTGELAALTAQSRLSALVIALAPVAFTAITAVTDHRTASYLFRSRPGNACLLAGLGLDLAGAAWMARITAGVDP